MSHTPPVPVVIGHIRLLLDRIGDALAEGRSDRLLATEQELGPALNVLSTLDVSYLAGLAPETRDAVRREIEGGRRALERCRRLGLLRDRLAAIVLETGGLSSAYTRGGDPAGATTHRTLEARG